MSGFSSEFILFIVSVFLALFSSPTGTSKSSFGSYKEILVFGLNIFELKIIVEDSSKVFKMRGLIVNTKEID